MINNMSGGSNWAALQPGTVVSTGRIGFRHFGIVTDRYVDGWPTVISNTGMYGKVMEESVAQFKSQWDLKVEGYWGVLPPLEVVARARAQLGSKYSLLKWNCEHFVRYVHGLRAESPQLGVAAVMVIFAVLLIGLSGA